MAHTPPKAIPQRQPNQLAMVLATIKDAAPLTPTLA
jgi:hypothetical protein